MCRSQRDAVPPSQGACAAQLLAFGNELVSARTELCSGETGSRPVVTGSRGFESTPSSASRRSQRIASCAGLFATAVEGLPQQGYGQAAPPAASSFQSAQDFVQRSQAARRSAAHIFASAESDEVMPLA